MKKTLSLVLTALLVVSLCLVFAACGDTDDATTLDWTTQPKTTFTVGESIDDFALSYTKDGQVVVIKYADYKEFITLTGFDTSKEGTFDASVSYEGKSLTFTYTVKAATIDSGFESGAGTETNPFVIKTAQQFLHLNDVDTEGKFFALGADINLSNVTFTDSIITKSFSGTLSGGANKYKLSLDGSFDCAIFQEIQKASLKDFVISFNGIGWKSLVSTATKENSIINVDSIGSVSCNDNNYAPYLTYNMRVVNNSIAGSAQTTLKDCDNGINITSMSYCGGFVSFPGAYSYNAGLEPTSLTFDNCTNTGTLIGTHVGMLFSNSSTTYFCNITAKNCTNKGIIRATTWNHLIFGAGNGPLGGVDYTRDGELVKDNIVNEGVCEAVASLTATTGEDGFITVTSTAAIAKVGFIIGYYANPVTGGTHYIQGVEYVDAVENSATSTKVGLFEVRPFASDVVSAMGYIATTDLGEWTINTIDGTDKAYVHENGTDVLTGIIAYNKTSIFAFGFDADGNIIAGAKVQ